VNCIGSRQCRRMPITAIARSARQHVFCTDEKRIRTENVVMDKSEDYGAFIRDRRLRVDVLFIRAQSTIRADGPPSAQA